MQRGNYYSTVNAVVGTSSGVEFDEAMIMIIIINARYFISSQAAVCKRCLHLC